MLILIMQKMEILPVNDLDVALHSFVNKDDRMAFYSCLQYNLQETRVSTLYCLPLHFFDRIKEVGIGFRCLWHSCVLKFFVCRNLLALS